MERSNKKKLPQHQTPSPRSLSRFLDLLDVLTKTPSGLTLAELSKVLDSPKSSLLNLLRPLVADDYLVHKDGTYRFGASIFRLAASITSVWNFPNVLRPYLEELAERTQETVYIAVFDRNHKNSTYVDVIESSHQVRYSVPVGAHAPLYCTAAGRVLLAFSSEKFQADYLRTIKLKAITPQTITKTKVLRAELKKVLKTGVAISVGEAVPEAAAIAAPILDADGKVKAAIVIGGPTERLSSEFAALEPVIKDIAKRASGLNRRERLGEVAAAEKAGE